jgi:hypothetical protein
MLLAEEYNHQRHVVRHVEEKRELTHMAGSGRSAPVDAVCDSLRKQLAPVRARVAEHRHSLHSWIFSIQGHCPARRCTDYGVQTQCPLNLL